MNPAPSNTQAAQLVLVHHAFVKGLALRHAPWPGLVDDITQQVFLEFLAKEDQWDLQTDLKPLLATMTRNIALRYWRQRTRELPEVTRQLAEHIRGLAEEQTAPSAYEDESGVLRRCIEKLPDHSRTLVNLYYYSEVPTKAIAEQMAMKTDTVCRALSRVRESLRDCIRANLHAETREETPA